MELKRETKFSETEQLLLKKFEEMNRNKDQNLKEGETLFKNIFDSI